MRRADSIVRPLAALCALLALTACQDVVDPGTPGVQASSRSPALESSPSSCPGCVVGPVTVTREQGTPTVRTFAFDADPQAGYVLDVTETDIQGLTGSIVLNDVVVITHADFASNSGGHARRRVSVQPHNRLEVRLEGKPGSAITIELRGGVQEIGGAGGVLRAPGGDVLLEIPPGALSRVSELSIARVPEPAGDGIFGSYELGPSGTTFAVPVRLSVAVDPSSLAAAGGGAQPMIIAQTSAATSEFVPGSRYDPATGHVSAPLQHFSRYLVVFVSPTDVGCSRVFVGSLALPSWLDCSPTPPGLYVDVIEVPVGGSVLSALAGNFAGRFYGSLWLAPVAIPSCDNTFDQRSDLIVCLLELRTASADPTIAYRDSAGRIHGVRCGQAELRPNVSNFVKGLVLVRVTGCGDTDPNAWQFTVNESLPWAMQTCVSTGSASLTLTPTSTTFTGSYSGTRKCQSDSGVPDLSIAGNVSLGTVTAGHIVVFRTSGEAGATSCDYNGTLSGTAPNRMSGFGFCVYPVNGRPTFSLFTWEMTR
jgi:hypothetical protein